MTFGVTAAIAHDVGDQFDLFCTLDGVPGGKSVEAGAVRLVEGASIVVVLVNNLAVNDELDVLDSESVGSFEPDEGRLEDALVLEISFHVPLYMDVVIAWDFSLIPLTARVDCEGSGVDSRLVSIVNLGPGDGGQEARPIQVLGLSPADFGHSPTTWEVLPVELADVPKVLTSHRTLNTEHILLMILVDTVGWIKVVRVLEGAERGRVLLAVECGVLVPREVECPSRSLDDIMALVGNPGASLEPRHNDSTIRNT